MVLYFLTKLQQHQSMTEIKYQIGEVYMDKVTQQKTIFPNKTRKYLLPCLREYGETFTNKLNNVFKIAVGIGDIITDNCGFKHEKHLFILIDSTIAHSHFINFLDWIRDQPMYEDDYVHDNIQKSKYHMVVLKFPEKYYSSFDTFKTGAYSNMYNQTTIENFFQSYPDVQKVFIKDHEYRITFTKKLNKVFDTTLTPEDWEGELDFPPKEKHEVFNHKFKKK
jgi:hypothetical protein